MEIIDTPLAMARALATITNPWLKGRLAQCNKRLIDSECEVGELGPIIIVQANDALEEIERAASVMIATAFGLAFPDPMFLPSWEWCEGDHGWYECGWVTDDFGVGAVLFIPDRDGIDATLRAIIQTHADNH